MTLKLNQIILVHYVKQYIYIVKTFSIFFLFNFKKNKKTLCTTVFKNLKSLRFGYSALKRIHALGCVFYVMHNEKT
jgi:hypothetical protein